MVACASFPENQRLENWHPSALTLMENASPEASREVVVLVAFSGGGTRAAALAYGVLEELRDTVVELDGAPRRLLDEVDLISGVSGGSFAAAYYGLFGDQIFEDFEERFLRHDVQGDLIRSVLNPINWLRLGSAGFGRSDLVAEYYDRNLFVGKTLGDFAERAGPAIQINATDLHRGTRFSFNPEQFDPICSDPNTYPVARAVAASSGVPGLLTPIVLRSYAGTCGYEPPGWVAEALAERRAGSRRYAQARISASYVAPDASSSIFLMDGGITDNLGIRAPFERVVSGGSLGTVLSEAGYSDARAVLMIVANAQNEPDLDLENSGNFVRNLALMAGITSGIQIRRFNFETLELVRTSFERWADQLSTPEKPFSFHMVEVGFAQVRDPERRRRLNNLPTSFVLDDEAVDQLRAAAGEVLRSSEDFKGFLDHLQSEQAGRSTP